MADESSDKLTYQIEVKVMTHMYGSFCQWLCFDLGEPRWRGARGPVSQPDRSSDPDAAIHNFGRYTRYIRKLMLECGSRVAYERVRAVPSKQAATTVFEALVVNRKDFNVEQMHSADFVYLSLSSHFVQQYALLPGQTIQVDVQFQLDRRVFVEWIYAIEELVSPDLIFPNTFIHANVSLIQKIHDLIAKYPKVEYALFDLLFHEGVIHKFILVSTSTCIIR